MRHSKLALCILGAAMLAAHWSPSRAQVNNYWTQQYGTRSNLLGGAVIGSVSDMSAVYYNPGAIALFKDPSILLSAQVYDYAAIKLEGGADEGKPLKTSSIRPAADLLAGTLTFGWLGDHKLAYSLLTREQSDIDIEGRKNSIAAATGALAASGGELIFSNNLKDLWAGLTWSHLLGKNVGIGLSSYLAIRDQKRRTQVLAEALRPQGEVASSILINQFEYENYRALWKAGLGCNFSPLSFGLTITTPSVGLFGSGSALYNAAVSGLDLDGDGNPENFLAGNYQEEVESQYHTSWAVGAGAAYRLGKTRIHLSAEWFDAVDQFTVLATKDFVAQSTGDTLSNPLTHELQEVLNYGIGIDFAMREHFTLYGSFATDFSGAVPGTETNLAITKLDVYNVAAGAAFTVARWELTLGGAYAFGSDEFGRALNFAQSDEDNPVAESLRNANLSYRRIKLMFGFSYKL